MLFDGYRKLLNFSVTAFNLEKLNSDTMRVAAFISAVNRLNVDKIDHLLNGKEWDETETLCADAQEAYRSLAAAKDNAVPAEVQKKYSLGMAKLEKERPQRASVIKEQTNKISALRKEIAGKAAAFWREDARYYLEKFFTVNGEVSRYCGENDRKLKEYGLFNTEYQNAHEQVRTTALKCCTAAYERAASELAAKQWTDEVLAASKKSVSELQNPAAYFLGSDFLSSYGDLPNVTKARDLLKRAQGNLVSSVNEAEKDLGAMKELQRLLDGSLLKDLKVYSKEAENAVTKCSTLWNGISGKNHFGRAASERIAVLEPLIRKLKQESESDSRVKKLNDRVATFNRSAAAMTFKTYTTYASEISGIRKSYGSLSSDEQKRIKGWDEFNVHCGKFDAFARKRRRKEANADRWDTFKDVFLNWLSTVWIPVLVAGACIGLFFLMRAEWYSTAPDWLFQHSVKLWGWRNWGTGTAFGVTNALYHSDIFILFKLVLYVLTVILDLFVYFLQAIWWVLSAISWPIRWGLSRLLGLILYGLAYGLPGILCVGACVGIGFCNFTYEKYWACHIVNMVLCVGVTALAYVAIFVF